MTAIWHKTKTTTGYETENHVFPLFVGNKMFTKYVPGFEGLYVTNINGDLAGLKRTIIMSENASGRTTYCVESKLHSSKKDFYNLSNKGRAVSLTRKGLIFYSGFSKPTFDENTVFPVVYKDKKWICWLPGNLHLKAALASDGSVLTMECMVYREGPVVTDTYSYLEERMYDINTTYRYRNKEKTLPMTRPELKNLARLKCLVLGITP